MVRFGKSVLVVQNGGMPSVFIPNFEFELELQGLRGSDAMRNRTAGLSWCWTALSRPGDVLLVEQGDDKTRFDSESLGRELVSVSTLDELSGDYQVVPWGWSNRTRELVRSSGLELPKNVSDEVVTRVNGRSWAFDLEAELGVTPAGASLVREFSELGPAVQRASSVGKGWVIKAELGMAGREQRRGVVASADTATLRWVKACLKAGQPVVVEPYLDLVAERGLQYQVHPTGRAERVGHTELLTTSKGQYRGSRLLSERKPDSELAWEDVYSIADMAAARLSDAGYCGPVGIDVAEYRDQDGNRQWRALQDVNARFTMGRLALGWSDVVVAGEYASWLQIRWGPHERVPELWSLLTESLPESTRVERTSVWKEGGNVAMGQVLIVSGGEPEQHQLAEKLVVETLEVHPTG